MDANQTPFWLVLGDDWLAARELCAPPGAEPLTPPPPERFALPPTLTGELADPLEAWVPGPAPATIPAEDHTIQLSAGLLGLCRRVERVLPVAGAPRLRLDDRPGAVLDEQGNVFRIAGDAIRFEPCPEHSEPFWAGGRGAELAGLVLTGSGLLVVGRRPNPGGEAGSVLVFDTRAPVQPGELPWAAPFDPFDLAAAPDGSVVVLDRAHRQLWRVTLTLGWRPPPLETPGFLPCEIGSIPPLSAVATRLGPTLEGDPVAVDVLSTGEVLVLVNGPRGGGAPVVLEVPLAGAPRELAALLAAGHDLVAVGDRVAVVDELGRQAWMFGVSRDPASGLALVALAELWPLYRYTGLNLAVMKGEPAYRSALRWTPLARLPRSIYAERGVLSLPCGQRPEDRGWDSGRLGCTWHRLMIDGVIPPDSRVLVLARAADAREELDAAPWGPQPPLVRRASGPELPFFDGEPGESTFELLLQGCVGRYLQLALCLEGDGSSTPRLRALRVYAPRFSYLEHYLPAVFRDDPTSAWLLDRLLANVEGLFTAIEDRVAAAQLLFQPEVAPDEWLPWLAGWFDAALDPAWDEPKRRFFLKHAMQFFAWRGTARGIVAAVRLAIEAEPGQALFDDDSRGVKIVEAFRIRDLARRGENADTAHRFTVSLPRPSLEALRADPTLARRLKELAARVTHAEKPAHTVFDVVFHDHPFELSHARLGVDTVVAPAGRLGVEPVALDTSALGQSGLAAPYPIFPRDIDGVWLRPVSLVLE